MPSTFVAMSDDQTDINTSCEEAVDFISVGFRAGILLRPLLNQAEEKFGPVAWATIGAQRALIAACFGSTPAFTFGYKREKSLIRLLLDEADRVCGPEIAEELTEAAYVRCSMPSPQASSQAIIQLRGATLRCSAYMSDVGLRLWYVSYPPICTRHSPSHVLCLS
jgi:hypothetical protein